ncbi:MAG: hypothetical protein HKN02_03695 [Rhodobacteraceae bacterium]|nr:hypothetical protein [Paracoccaceae bacterium]
MNAPNALNTTDDIIHRLRDVLTTGALPRSATERGERILERLTSPVRVVLLGLPDAGKASLLNAIVGRELTNDDCQTTIEFTYGDRPRAHVTLADGSILETEGTFAQDDFPDAIFVSQELPLPILRRISLIDVVADPAPEELGTAITWALSRTDIAVWCSMAFTEDELTIWEYVPEAIMDHAFLVLTGTPQDQGNKILQARADHLRETLSGEFLDVFALNGLRGPVAGEETPDNSAGVLTDRILQHSELGRTADADGALLFLRAHDETLSRLRDQATAQAPARPVEKETSDKAVNPAQRAVYSAAYAYLRARGAQLLKSIRQSENLDTSTLIDYCGETVSHLGELVASSEDTTPAELIELTETLTEAEELFVLLELEKGTTSSVDAVSLLLQLRRDFETRLAV